MGELVVRRWSIHPHLRDKRIDLYAINNTISPLIYALFYPC